MPHLIALPLVDAAPRSFAAMSRLAATVSDEALAAGIPQRTLELVKLRASLLNGCTYCIALHRRDALALGEPAELLDAVERWEGSTMFGVKERTALALTDAVTRQGETGGLDADVLRDAADVWGEARASHLVLAATVINAWNRIGVAAGMEPEDVPAA